MSGPRGSRVAALTVTQVSETHPQIALLDWGRGDPMASGEEGAWTGRGKASLGRTEASWTTDRPEQPNNLPLLGAFPRNGPACSRSTERRVDM